MTMQLSPLQVSYNKLIEACDNEPSSSPYKLFASNCYMHLKTRKVEEGLLYLKELENERLKSLELEKKLKIISCLFLSTLSACIFSIVIYKEIKVGISINDLKAQIASLSLIALSYFSFKSDTQFESAKDLLFLKKLKEMAT